MNSKGYVVAAVIAVVLVVSLLWLTLARVEQACGRSGGEFADERDGGITRRG